jgi:immune inhibitor A
MRRPRPLAYLGLVLLTVALLLSGCTPIWNVKPSAPTATIAPATDPLTATCPVWTAPDAPVNIAPPARASAQAIAAYNAQRVLQTPRPVRNFYSIAQRLVTHGDSIPCRVRSGPRNERVGDERTFWVVNPDQSGGYHQIRARLAAVTPHLYMYVENGAQISNDAILASARVFETHSYPNNRKYFGSQWFPGPDDDPHITVLNARYLGQYLGGYFSSEDEFPRAVSPYSNERQMIYINLASSIGRPGTPEYNSTIAHEFQHMIHWFWHPGDDSWQNEGMSVVAQHLNGYSVQGMDDALLANPDTMLGGWTGDSQTDFIRYGAGYLFLSYLAQHYGGYETLRGLLTTPEQDPLNIDTVLAASGSKDRFNDVFGKYVLANLLNDPTIANGIYAYPEIPGKRVTVQNRTATYPYDSNATGKPSTVAQYAAQYYEFAPGASSGALTVHFAGQPTIGIVPNTPYKGATAEWWSNSGNQMDSTLTRAFDLTALAGKPVTLNFATWYQLEKDYDYAYVAVSDDGGKNWMTVPTTTSTTTNPNGGNYGNGMTGNSGGGKEAQWINESADLSRWAGKKIQLRFESITDDALHLAGMTIDALSIPQLNFADNVSTDNGWTADGWIRSNNVLPEQYLVQAAVYTAGQPTPTIMRVPVDAASGVAQATFPNFGGTVTRVLLAVSAMAPTTQTPAAYHLTADVR